MSAAPAAVRAVFTGSRDWRDEAPVRAVIDALPANAVVMATIALVSRADPDTVEWSWTVPMVNVAVDAMTVSATLGVDYLMRQQAVRLRHDPNTSPGLFQD